MAWKTKTIEFTLEEVLNLRPHLIEFLNRTDIPLDISYKMSKVAKQILDEAKEIDKQKQKIVEKHTKEVQVEVEPVKGVAKQPGEEPKPKLNKKVDQDTANEEWIPFIKENKIKIEFSPIPISLLVDKDGNKLEIPGMFFRFAGDLFTDEEPTE